VTVAQAKNFVASRPDWIIDRITAANVTNIRAFVTMFLAIWTAWRYFAQPKWGIWEPSVEWLGFLVALGGLDVAQFGIKRRTYVAGGASDTPPQGGTSGNPPS
jgi:hypothetical protein